MTDTCAELSRELWQSLDGARALSESLHFTGEGALPSAWRVSDLAAATLGTAELAVAELAGHALGAIPALAVDRRLASFWFGSTLRADGWVPAGAWDAFAGDYRTADGWIRIHTNAPRHRAATLALLGHPADREAMARAVRSWSAQALESAIVAAGGCAAEFRSETAWRDHRQGRALASEPPVATRIEAETGGWTWHPDPARPLAGLRVLDLTRVIAGPSATRFLAGYGANVLRIDPPDWSEPALEPEVTVGKRCARLDIKTDAGRRTFEALLTDADILVHGYRPDALAAIGLATEVRRRIAPGHIDIALDAYGWTGPWASRRGYDSLVQSSSGIAHGEMEYRGGDKPGSLPVAALDYAAGYLMAAAAVRGVTRRLTSGEAISARVSLARTARLLVDLGKQGNEPAFAPETQADFGPDVEDTAWGKARRLRPAARIEGVAMRWDRPALGLGSATPAW